MGFVVYYDEHNFFLSFSSDERNLLSNECQHLSGLLDTERLRVSELERTLEAVREESSQTQQSLQEALTQQTRHRQVAEEDCRAQTEVLLNLLDNNMMFFLDFCSLYLLWPTYGVCQPSRIGQLNSKCPL